MAFTNAARNLSRVKTPIASVKSRHSDFAFLCEKLLLHGLSCDARITIKLKIQRKFQTLAFLWILLKQYTYSFEVVFLTEVYFTEIESKIENAKVSTRACAKNLNSKSTLFRSEMTIITSFIKYCWLKNRVGENLGF